MESSRIRTLLQRLKPQLQEVDRFEFESELDSAGEEATWIWVVLKDDAPNAWSWENKKRIRTRITDEIQKADIKDWVYVRFKDENAAPASSTVSST